MADRHEPSFGELLRANARVCAFALALAVIAWYVWDALAALFPDVAWLQRGK